MKRLVDLPEINVALFAFLLNLVWEFGQVPLYRDLPSLGHWASIKPTTLIGLYSTPRLEAVAQEVEATLEAIMAEAAR